ncbi:tRNA lysidine(34) synthetase TilS [Mangrovivirga sp. M17]|uniref:tRNA(Ile)-lysidine synthase n=1 Tax=Mangrovivirga halotolerans TaxID=2993936 RepID=A0ABT3RMH2_9BACT|nr:tRNA lysidine(34) synthetase TilS [Mangrovivirga halotolerans]MCX2742558.1 tRNA lysidine(34) synthetase TilS [Mangrovivirga halotolerans]
MVSDSLSVNFIKNISQALDLKNNAVCYVACSGGLDSTVLAYLSVNAGLNTILLHCNFQLRGEESENDEEFVRQLANDLGVKCEVKKFDTLRVSAETGENTQVTARNLRYSWFENILGEKDYILTAHHHNDNVETLIFNLIKGTGVKGLRGIPEKRGRIYRPLLNFSRDQIKNFAIKYGINWREDSSNYSDKYNRNYLRNNVIPSFKEINPSFIETMKSQMEYFRRLESFYDRGYKDFIKKELVEYKGFKAFEISRVTYHPDHKLFLSDLFNRLGFTESQVNDIFSSITSSSGKIFESPNAKIIKDRNHWLIDFSMEDDIEVKMELNFPGENEVHGKKIVSSIFSSEEYKINPDPNIAALDFDKLKKPLIIRSWREGDWFIPLGMKGKKKLSDFMIDAKIPLSLKSKMLVVESDGEIVWVVGFRIDNRYKLTSKTRKILQLSVKD